MFILRKSKKFNEFGQENFPVLLCYIIYLVTHWKYQKFLNNLLYEYYNTSHWQIYYYDYDYPNISNNKWLDIMIYYEIIYHLCTSSKSYCHTSIKKNPCHSET